MTQQRANIFARGKFDAAALLQIARNIRQVPCWCDEGQDPKDGSFNWVIFICFQDGVEWVFRSPRSSDSYGLKQDIASELLASEVATLKYLRAKSDIPVPEVFSYSATEHNDIGIPYILMSKAPGMTLSTFGWKENMKNAPNVAYNNREVLTPTQKQKVMKQLGRICASLSNLRFNQLGSLLLKDKNYVISKSLYPGLTWEGRDQFGDDIPRGPFDDARAFYSALMSAFLVQVKDLTMDHHLFHAPVPVPTEYDDYNDYYTATDRWNDYTAVGSKIDSDENRLDYALVGIALTDIVPLLVERDNLFKCSGFPLCHPDLSTSNIFVDGELNITCIIDWSFASALPPSMFLVCPGLPHARDNTKPYLFPSFTEGFLQGHGFDGQTDLDHSNSSIFWSFARLANFDALQDYHYFFELIHALTGQGVVYPVLHKLKNRLEVLQTAQYLSEYKSDAVKEAEREAQYFSCVSPERHALSRHLTVMAELNPCFIADRRLWKWIALYLEDRQLYMFSGRQGPGRSWSCSLMFWRSLLHQFWGYVCPRFLKGIRGF